MFWKRTNPKTKELETLTAAHAQQGTFSGVVLVEKDGQVLLHQAYGAASHELGVLMQTHHRFNIGSVSKTLTALTVLRLKQKGKLNLQDSLSSYVPEFVGGGLITLHHLLSNTSGLPDYLMQEGTKGWYTLPHKPVELLEIIRDETHLFAPGERLGYSNTNWVLLAMVVERVMGKPWSQALDDLLLKPYDLEQTQVGGLGQAILGRVSGYRLEADQPQPALPIDPSVEVGAGGIFSTAGDLLKLEQALQKDPLYQQMAAPVAQEGGLSYGYGLISGERFGRRWTGHSGGTFGFTSFLTLYPDERLTVIVLSNLENGSAMQLEQDLAATVLGQPYALPTAHQVVQVSPEVLNQHVGTYRSEFMGRPMNFEVRSESGSLTVQFPLLPKASLQPLSENRFVGRIKGGEVRFTFKPDGVTMDWAGTLMESPRVSPRAPTVLPD